MWLVVHEKNAGRGVQHHFSCTSISIRNTENNFGQLPHAWAPLQQKATRCVSRCQKQSLTHFVGFLLNESLLMHMEYCHRSPFHLASTAKYFSAIRSAPSRGDELRLVSTMCLPRASVECSYLIFERGD